ncbi:MAG: hypothetical protein JWM47_2422 [Acidimicrobiales bacterium]|nr:hypothetical protein [Acidimicrobiales bacterium]
MRRVLGMMICAGLLVGAGCSKSDGGGGSGGNGAVQEYCDAVDDYAAKVKEAGTDPAKVQALATETTELGKKLAALQGGKLSAAETKELTDCAASAAG